MNAHHAGFFLFAPEACRRTFFAAYSSPVLRDEQATPEQIAILRTMSGERRLQLAESLYWSARKLKAAGLRSQHSNWSEEQVQREVTRIFLHART